MLKKLIPLFLFVVVVTTMIPSLKGKAQVIDDIQTIVEELDEDPIDFTIANSKLRASSIISGTGWAFSNDRCTFTVDFLRTSNGSGKVSLQRKVSYSWINYKSTNIEFSNSYSAGGGILVSNLPAGEYRLKFDITANNVSETIYTGEKTLY